MPIGRCSIKGGLPVWAKVHFGYDSFNMEHYAEVEEIYWCKRDGSIGKAVTQKVFDQATANYGDADIIEQVTDYLVMKDYEAEHGVQD